MRNAFADEITRLCSDDPRIVLLSGDIGNRLFDRFKEAAPNRFFNCGIAEGNMMGVAAGLGLNGFRPIVYTITPFATMRCLEQIRVDVCYHKSPVIIVGTGAGLSYSQLGPTHHSLEDIAILRCLPEMTVFCPCDALELKSGLRAALNHDGPVYIRIGKKGEPVFHDDIPDVIFGKSITMREGSDICLLATGNIMGVALDTASLLEEAGISPRIESFHSVKPLDDELLRMISKQYRLLAIVEEHGKIGGLSSAISEWYLDNPQDRPEIVALGLDDAFIHRVGTQSQTRQRAGLSGASFAESIKQAWQHIGAAS